MAEATINGKRVVLKDALRGRDGWRVVDLLRKFADEKQVATYDDNCELMSLVVESWEFDGDPADPASYEALDTFREFNPLGFEVGTHVNEMMQPKN
jgi:hypothetical protein